MLTLDDFDFLIVVISNDSQDIMQNTEAKKATMYEKIETELRGVQQALHSSHAVSIVPPPSEEPKLGDEPAQLRRIVDATEARGLEASTTRNGRSTSSCAAREG
jgi:hypothetical protein